MKSFRRGDTLVEVALAIGIFSLVAIAVVSVVSITTSSAQSALEVTLTREEIDAQAEAIRFIHSSYVAGSADNTSLNKKYKDLWNAIVKDHSADLSDASNNGVISFLNDNISSCSDVFADTGIYKQYLNDYGFILNLHRMGITSAASSLNTADTDASSVVIRPTNDTGNKFHAASTYPHLIYGSSLDDDNKLLNTAYADDLYRAEGIYIIAVKDNNSTTIVQDGSVDPSTSAYYDFYIRTCWYAPGAEQPSTISTVIRLVDPNAIDYGHTIPTPSPTPIPTPVTTFYSLSFNQNTSGEVSNMPDNISNIGSGTSKAIPDKTPASNDKTFLSWNTEPDGNGDSYYPEDPITMNGDITLYAIWQTPEVYTLHFDLAGASGTAPEDLQCTVNSGKCVIKIPYSEQKPYKDDLHEFVAWGDSDMGYPYDTEIDLKVIEKDRPDKIQNYTLTLYPKWKDVITDPPPCMEDPWDCF